MMDLRNIILEKKDHLPKQTGKLVNRLYNKKITMPGNQLYTKLCNKYVANFTSLMRRENQQIQLMLILCYPVI